jgi:glycosyltransferase involved in cell wall biosynthesis
MAAVDVLIPTYRRPLALAVTLAGVHAQSLRDFTITISDQTDEQETYLDRPEIRTLIEALRWRGIPVTVHRHLPRSGMAEHRQFLLEQAQAPYVHFLDDDVLLDPGVLGRMLEVIRGEGCGFVGCAATGLSYLADERPHQQEIELWDGRVRPEPFAPGAIPIQRHLVNNAANPLHLEKKLLRGSEVLRYKVAWIGGANVLYDRAKLLDVGGFSFWRLLPPVHAGEEVVVQFLLIRRYGGCGILPSGTYHLELETTLPDRSSNAAELFATLLRQLGEEHEEVV